MIPVCPNWGFISSSFITFLNVLILHVGKNNVRRRLNSAAGERKQVSPDGKFLSGGSAAWSPGSQALPWCHAGPDPRQDRAGGDKDRSRAASPKKCGAPVHREKGKSREHNLDSFWPMDVHGN